jgi:hypothetical protein
MYWGSGSTLGLLTCLGYGLFVLGAYQFWRHRGEFVFWMNDGISALRRSLCRFVPSGPFYQRRGESRLLVIPAGFLRFFRQFARSRCFPAVFLLILGMLLFALDFFI